MTIRGLKPARKRAVQSIGFDTQRCQRRSSRVGPAYGTAGGPSAESTGGSGETIHESSPAVAPVKEPSFDSASVEAKRDPDIAKYLKDNPGVSPVIALAVVSRLRAQSETPMGGSGYSIVEEIHEEEKVEGINIPETEAKSVVIKLDSGETLKLFRHSDGLYYINQESETDVKSVDDKPARTAEEVKADDDKIIREYKSGLQYLKSDARGNIPNVKIHRGLSREGIEELISYHIKEGDRVRKLGRFFQNQENSLRQHLKAMRRSDNIKASNKIDSGESNPAMGSPGPVKGTGLIRPNAPSAQSTQKALHAQLSKDKRGRQQQS